MIECKKKQVKSETLEVASATRGKERSNYGISGTYHKMISYNLRGYAASVRSFLNYTIQLTSLHNWYPMTFSSTSHSPSISKPSGCSNIICINKIRALGPQLPPDAISCANRPTRLVPIPHHDPLRMCGLHLCSQQSKLSIVQTRA